MKKAIAFICILTLCLSLCACGKTEISESTSEESKSESVSESKSLSESISVSDTDPESENTASLREASKEAFKAISDKYRSVECVGHMCYGKAASGFSRINIITDNAIDKNIIFANQRKMPLKDAYVVASDSLAYYSAYLNFITEYLGYDIFACREISEGENEETGEIFKICYAIFETETDGYVYIFFNYYPERENDNCIIRLTAFAENIILSDEFLDMVNSMLPSKPDSLSCLLDRGDGRWDFELPSDKYTQIFPAESYLVDAGASYTRLLSDAVIYIQAYANDKHILGILYNKLPATYNYTILPQDYPPAN